MATLRNPVKEALRAGGTVYGTLVSMPSPHVVQVLSASGFDWLWFDLEHGSIPFDSLHGMVNATATGDGRTTPIVRVPADELWTVKPVLDCGALGVVFPFIETAEQARNAIAATRYPPAGKRGFGPFFAGSRWGLGLREYAEQADDAILRVLMLESVHAVNNAEEIMATEGIDVAFLAPFDLSQSLGVPGEFDSSVFKDALATLEAAVAKSDATLGTLVLDAERGKMMKERGYRFVMLSLDIALLEGAARDLIDAVR
ncbi:MAG: aldolase/citrate lyase family protein [Rhodospirillales bacterium]